MSSSGYTPWSVTAGEQPTTAYWNILGTNDESFNTGTGFNDGIILLRHMASSTLVDGQSQTPSGSYFYIGKTLIQFASTVFSLPGANPQGWSVSWPKTFNTTQYITWAKITGWSPNTYGGIEGFSTTGASGFVRTDNTSVRNCTVYCMAMGT